jgi:hypothetical protein
MIQTLKNISEVWPHEIGEWTQLHIEVNKKPTNALILQCIDTRHSPAFFGTLKCHNKESIMILLR